MKRLFMRCKGKSQTIISATALVLAVMIVITIPQLSIVLARYTSTVSPAATTVRAGRFDVVTSSRDYIGQGNWSAEANIIQLTQAGPTVTTFELPLFDFAYSTNDGRGGFPTVLGSDIVEHVFRPREPFGHNNASAHILENAPAGYYAFIIRGGDGGAGRLPNGNRASYGGAGGLVMGYFRLDTPQTLFIEVGSAGRGGNTQTQPSRAHFGGGNNTNAGGQGGGATTISTVCLRTQNAWGNHIAVAGGGGGGGGSNGTQFHINNNGGNAGGAGGGTGAQANPILNGSAADQVGTSGVFMGRMSAGFQSGNPAAMLKDHQAPGRPGSPNAPSTSGGGGGGGGVGNTQAGGVPGGSSGTAGTTGWMISGGNAGHSGNATNGSGGGGSGWLGGGGGGNNQGWHGGGGGGASYARNDVRPLSNDLIASDFFSDLVALQAYALSNARYAQGNPPRVVVRDELRSIALQDPSIIEDYANAGWNGFAYIVYTGPVHPSEAERRALVVAPGTGLFGAPLSNPNTTGESSEDGIFRYTTLDFHNRSEVPVRIRIEYDPVNSRMPNVSNTGVVAMGTGASAGLRPPILIRPFVANIDNMFMISETTALRNIYRNRLNTGRIVFAMTNDHRTGLPFASLVNNDGWIVLQPGQATGVDLPTVGIGWVWFYDVEGMPIFDAGGIRFGHGTTVLPNPIPANQRGRGYNTWGTVTAQPNRAQNTWHGLNNPAIIPHISGTTRADNIDRFDTILGREAARRRQNGLPPLEISLAFRITIEQLAA
ncbi:MAG: glycine-rich protein [Oscillospiraceae bacterium]|nr:glycine-rich protein [Oscillospiraceae bacterium]